MTKKQQAEQEKQEAITKLREWIKPGDTIKCILRHVSRSGMQREISLLAVVDGDCMNIDYWAARAMGDRIGKHGGIVIGGCGMDMGFALVYNLSSVLFRDGFECTGRSEHPNMCPSCDHSNGDRDYTPHMHTSGGYALRKEWI
jgi:hypothetical protein